MNPLPLISHRMFLAAMGQKYPRPHLPRPSEDRHSSQPSQIRWEAVPQLRPRREPRTLVAELLPSHF